MPPHKVREVTARLEAEGWELLHKRGKGSHRRYGKDGNRITVSGKLGDDMKPGTYSKIERDAGWK